MYREAARLQPVAHRALLSHRMDQEIPVSKVILQCLFQITSCFKFHRISDKVYKRKKVNKVSAQLKNLGFFVGPLFLLFISDCWKIIILFSSFVIKELSISSIELYKFGDS